MKKILLTALSWISNVPGSTVNEIYTAATDIVARSDADKNATGWKKLETTVDYLVTLLPVDASYKAVGSVVVTIIVNVALLIIRLKSAAK